MTVRFMTLLFMMAVNVLSQNHEGNRGIETHVQITWSNLPKSHESPDGISEIIARSVKTDSVVFLKKLSGLWYCLGYNAGISSYILVGKFIVGASFPLTTMAYLDDRAFVWRNSRYDARDWSALTAVVSPKTEFVCFAGQLDNWKYQLEVLDVAMDSIKILGDAPAPPPDSSYAIEGNDWNWGDPVDSYTPMDHGILEFTSDKTLSASYGNDNGRKRSVNRKKKEWNLRKEFQLSK